TLATLCADGLLRFWEVHTRSNVGAVSASANAYIGALDFSPDGSLLAFSDARPGWITISNLATGTSFTTNTYTSRVTALRFSPDATLLVSRDWDDTPIGQRGKGTIKLWEIHADRLTLKHVLSHTGWGVSTVAFSPDGRRLISTSVDQTLKLWDVKSGRLLHTQKSPVGNPNAALFLPDGNTIAVANFDSTITLWDVTNEPWRERAVLQDNGATWGLALSPDGTELASGQANGGEVKLWSLTSPSERNDWLPFPTNAFAWFFSTDARRILLALTNQTIDLWDSATLTKAATVAWPETNTRSFALHSDGNTIASGSANATVTLWRLNSGVLSKERSFSVGGQRVFVVLFSPDGKTVAASAGWPGSQGGPITLCDAARGEKLVQLPDVHTYHMRFSPDGTHLVSLSWDGNVKLWEVATGRCVWTGKHEQTAVDGAFFPDGRRIVTGAWDTKARLWDAASGRELTTLPVGSSVAVSPDGRRVAIGGGVDAVKLYMFGATHQPLEVATLVSRANGVEAVAFLPDGQTLVARCREGFQIWRAPSFGELAANEKMENGK
ncbi:MAG: hypothetical protein DME26_03630, partial [Verrucomicrobia bacterium]